MFNFSSYLLDFSPFVPCLLIYNSLFLQGLFFLRPKFHLCLPDTHCSSNKPIWNKKFQSEAILGMLWWEALKSGTDQSNIVGLYLKKGGGTEFNCKFKLNPASLYFHIIATIASRPSVNPTHTLTPDPLHKTISLNSENYNEANMLASMADSAKLKSALHHQLNLGTSICAVC